MSFREFVEGHLVNFIDGAVIPLLYSLAFLFFVYGIATTFISTDEEKRKKGRVFALWGIIGLVVLFGVWGVVKLFLSVLTSA